MTKLSALIDQLKSAPKDKPFTMTIPKDTPSFDLVTLEKEAEKMGWFWFKYVKEQATFMRTGEVK